MLKAAELEKEREKYYLEKRKTLKPKTQLF
jgi:hypothetical protein